MSTVVLAVHDTLSGVLAQAEPTLEAPPVSEKYLQFMRYLPWLLGLIVLTLVVTGGGVALMVIREKNRVRRRQSGRPGESLRQEAPPVQAPLIPKHQYPVPGARPAPDPAVPEFDFGPPDPTVWGRPRQ